jgi:hypothetical protein
MTGTVENVTSPLESIETQHQLAFIREVFERKLPVRLWGGYADDALLSGRVSRLHHDVDFVAMRSDIDTLKVELRKLGYEVAEELLEKGAKPYKLLVKGKNILADVALFDIGKDGHPIIDILYSKNKRHYKVLFSEDMFEEAGCSIEGIPVVTVSPIALIRSKDAYFQAGVAGSRPKDVRGKDALMRKFFPDSDTTSDFFKLKIERERE